MKCEVWGTQSSSLLLWVTWGGCRENIYVLSWFSLILIGAQSWRKLAGRFTAWDLSATAGHKMIFFAFIGLYSPLGLTALHSHTVLGSAAKCMPPVSRAEEKTWLITAEQTLVLKSFVIFSAQQRQKTTVFRSLIRCQHSLFPAELPARALLSCKGAAAPWVGFDAWVCHCCGFRWATRPAVPRLGWLRCQDFRA